jgi:uncharacterized protein (DUF362 family)
MAHTRRQFIGRAACVGSTALVSTNLHAQWSTSFATTIAQALTIPTATALVAVVRRPGVLKNGQPRADVVKQMVQKAVCLATGIDSPQEAFASLFKPDDVVGIKVNCLAGRGLSSRPEVAYALAQCVVLAGVKPHNVVIWERSERELKRAGYTLSQARGEIGVVATAGDYESEPIDAGSVGGCLSRIVTRRCTAQISLPVLKDHDLAGVSASLKNWYGAIHNPNKYHDNQCSPFVADLFGKSVLCQRTRLSLCDALTAQCHGGPAYSADFAWPCEAILASVDSVALDAVGAQLIERKRKKRGLPTLNEAQRPPRWLTVAQNLNAGVADISRIKVVES